MTHSIFAMPSCRRLAISLRRILIGNGGIYCHVATRLMMDEDSAFDISYIFILQSSLKCVLKPGSHYLACHTHDAFQCITMSHIVYEVPYRTKYKESAGPLKRKIKPLGARRMPCRY